MDENLVNAEALEIDNHVLEEAIDTFIQNQTEENMARMMVAMKGAEFLVPAEFPNELDPEIEKCIEEGRPFPEGKEPDMHPVLVENEEGERFAPAITSAANLDESEEYQVIIKVEFEEIMRIASAPELELKGILINPSTTQMILHPDFIEAMQEMELELEGDDSREVTMTASEFEVFARHTVEWGVFPSRYFEDGTKFLKDLEEQGESYICDLYQEPFGELPNPYSADDFSIMKLNINEETSVVSIELPEVTAAELSHSIYLIHNPKTDELKYFLIESTEERDKTLLTTIDSDGNREVLRKGPEAGSELFFILDYLKSERK